MMFVVSKSGSDVLGSCYEECSVEEQYLQLRAVLAQEYMYVELVCGMLDPWNVIIGATLSEPHLVSSTAALSIYLFIYIPHRTSSTRDHLFNMCTVYSRSQIKTFVPRPTLDGDSSRGWYGLPGTSAQRSQASGSDKLAGSSKHL